MEEIFSKSRTELFRVLKAAKGFERLRLAKRIHDPKSTSEKIQRLEREVVVLKSLDLNQAANAHLASSLLRVKTLATSPGLPDSIKSAVARLELSEDERVALHNVTSALGCLREAKKQLYAPEWSGLY